MSIAGGVLGGISVAVGTLPINSMILAMGLASYSGTAIVSIDLFTM